MVTETALKTCEAQKFSSLDPKDAQLLEGRTKKACVAQCFASYM